MKTQKIDLRFKTFNSRDYLNEYYTHIGSENYTLLKFSFEVSKHMSKNSLVLEFSGGPTIYPLISLAPKAKELHFSDFLTKNLAEIKLWKTHSPKSFNWSSFVKCALQIEGKKNIKIKDISKREELLRKKMTTILVGNAFESLPLGKRYSNLYDLVNVNFVTDSITSSKTVWEKLLTNISSLIKKNGLLAMSSLKNAYYWRTTENKFFPAVNLSEKDVKKAFKKLRLKIISFSSIPAEILDEKSAKFEGYKGMMFTIAKKT